ncbi:MAG: DUF362 domain-containing protein [Clostridia bacterium]|nr:DUF362 domain-containing protein [Clostridia bacterium]
MPTSKVYWCDMRTHNSISLPAKLKRLIKAAGIETIDFKEKFTAIKLHFGEPGNLAFLRPNFAKVIADTVKEQGGKPFLTDCNTLYVGGRRNGLDHLDAAAENGFSPLSCGCNIVIADGIKGTDDIAVPVKGGEYITEAKIGRAIMDADIFISLSHFKGHENTGFGGAIKNIGMGCGSRAGKMEQHNGGKPQVQRESCISCGRCARICAHGAVSFPEKKALIDHDKCVGCGRCVGVCNDDAIHYVVPTANDDLCRKMAEYTKAVVDGRPCFHVNIIMDVSPCCDCHGENDMPIIPNVGMFASFDPVALDVACADACNRQPLIRGSVLDEAEHSHGDHFCDVFPETNWKVMTEHAEKIGVGSCSYELIRVEK